MKRDLSWMEELMAESQIRHYYRDKGYPGTVDVDGTTYAVVTPNGSFMIAVPAESSSLKQLDQPNVIEATSRLIREGLALRPMAQLTTRASDIRVWAGPHKPTPSSDCPRCKGKGEHACKTCRGSGTVRCECLDCGNEHDAECDDCQGIGIQNCVCIKLPRHPRYGQFGTQVFDKALFAGACCAIDDDKTVAVFQGKEPLGALWLYAQDWLIAIMPVRTDGPDSTVDVPYEHLQAAS